MHLQLPTIGVALLLPITSVFAGIITPPSSSTLDIMRRAAPEEHSIQALDDRSALASASDERLPQLYARDDDDDKDDDNDDNDDERDDRDDDDDDDDDDSVLDKLRDKAGDIGDDIKDGASDIKDDVKDEVDDVFDDGVGALRPGIILPGLFAAVVVAVAGM
ncbi:uncharacterized protein KD926_009064 [Aspergillus affinis]|uniref:uncharacterized protein n=1 Tax=Aspergillus affinis TaxID=1070780 RepID=UPI0022FED143|nr:uncharacterized protein KD926_009064 [Aspergillus affinis]KAI9039845.1 hypothetical protein KD926_009064 [Aspergillus affinis]